MLHKVDEHLEGLRLQRAEDAPMAQLIALRIDFVVAKDVAHGPSCPFTPLRDMTGRPQGTGLTSRTGRRMAGLPLLSQC